MTLSYLLKRLGAIAVGGAFFGLVGLGNAYAVGPGADVCKGCHEDATAAYAKTIHGAAGNKKGPAGAGECSACHGDGTKHVEAGGGKGAGGILNPNSKTLSAEQKSAACLTCHEGNRNLAFWDSGQHKRNDVSCNNCHSIHGASKGSNDKMLKAGEPSIGPMANTIRQLQHETCNACHKDKGMEILKPSHHPIIEGKVKCSDCHNPHGALSKAMIKSESNNDLCLGCHTDKRGPWIHEHPPVEENCLICHNPHGSQHMRLLVQRPPQLCGDCHPGGHTHGIYDGRPATAIGGGNVRFISGGCVNCHRQLHGSNGSSAAYGNFLVR